MSGGAAGEDSTGLGGVGGVPTQTAGEGGEAGNGAEPCTDTSSDPLNCGSCGHSCLGGACADGVCQPLLLGTVPSTVDASRQIFVSSEMVYVLTQVGEGTPNHIWQTSAKSPATPTEPVKMDGGDMACIMNGTLFWTQFNPIPQPEVINSCALSNCTATTKTVAAVTGDFFEVQPGCDVANNELVWVESSSTNTVHTIFRASATGTNARSVTSLRFPGNLNGQFLNGDTFASDYTERLFYAASDDATNQVSLYGISTDTVNAAGALLFGPSNGALSNVEQQLLVNDSLVLVSNLTPSTYQILKIPLPNGLLSGVPPVFASGTIGGGVVDATNFYGTLQNTTTVPPDAVVRCPLSDCTTQTIIVRGQQAAQFGQDASAIYWTTGLTVTGFSIWKAAK